MRSYLFLLASLLAAFRLQAQKTNKVSRVFYESLQVQNGIAYLKNSPFTGISIKQWENRQTNEEISWVDGLKDGIYKEFTETGVLVASETWSRGIKHGEYFYYYPNGILKNKGHFVNGNLDGEIWGYYQNGKAQYVNNYESGVRQGRTHTWFSNGSSEQTGQFVNNLPHGEILAWYPDSTPRYQTTYNMGVKQGRNYRWHKTGCPAEESYYKNGNLDSIRRLYDELNCTLLEVQEYKNGLKNGSFIKFGFRGDTLSIENWTSDKLDGRYVIWRDREIETSGYYSAGEPDGYWKYGMTSHYQMREGLYERGVMTGMWKFYDADGELLARQWYDNNGEVVKSKVTRKKKK
jgi:antitoxin component YwqK of YwqJK toxin-antitoxin module